jgi:hypothetical protein
LKPFIYAGWFSVGQLYIIHAVILYSLHLFVYEFPLVVVVVQRLMLDRQISKISFFAEYSFITFLNLSAVISSFM